ncbi:hypothetical protein NQ315_003751 [Exocentrus adspersus]|uniref:Uncharacterized protein n=1 Tax=Exocentrus adspersus TaxID=1586481 RepID=A0AAV8VIC6_9CUCU|nr:hypothetical protein NQ315_003751 [Exocentrus adspersus]
MNANRNEYLTNLPTNNIPDEFKSIDKTFVTENTVKLGSRTRNQQKKKTKTRKISIDKINKGSSRLAQPKIKQQSLEDSSWKIKKSVLNYKASKRILSLSKPKTVKVPKEITPQTSFQSTVSAKALHYKPTARILELAKPKNYETVDERDYESDFFDEFQY